MSIIVWTPQGMAADRQSTNGTVRSCMSKLFPHRINGVLYGIGFTGEFDRGFELIDWFREGAVMSAFPNRIDEMKVRLIVGCAKSVYSYECRPYPLYEQEPYAAFGSGREVAYGALDMGASARRAVEICCNRDTSCGMGIDEVVF